MRSISFKKGKLFYLDQTKLPLVEKWQECSSIAQGYRIIKLLKIRGAPLIGVFAAYCLAVSAEKFAAKKDLFLKQATYAISHLKASRPTAVNLFWALDRMQAVLTNNPDKDTDSLKKLLLKQAALIHSEDVALCKNMGRFGVSLIRPGDRILTHCNTGFLATSGNGTALSVIYEANKKYKDIEVFIDETRPLLQGARLTAWELCRKKVPCRLITDNMSAYCMQQGLIDKVFLGADRITANGDVANKIGTYSVAVLAKYHKIPFYVVAPFSSFDLNLNSPGSLPIEQRNPDEIRKVFNRVYIAPRNVKSYNPAFDVTPGELITAIVTDKGIIYPPFNKNIPKILEK
ncbi:MAG: S-methyl-5-thioribose-1-phosphate isomerase [Candidatus Omnitrophica bacterium]|nr:S-methyl-5-thioribose-1-phosphate isomerase [Candidatus Omnitrophota bacterium]